VRRPVTRRSAAIAGAAAAAVLCVSAALGLDSRDSTHASLYGDGFANAWGVESGDLVVYAVGCPTHGGELVRAMLRVAKGESVIDSGSGRLVAESLSSTPVDGATRFEMRALVPNARNVVDNGEVVIVEVSSCGAAFMDDRATVQDGQVDAGGWVTTAAEFIRDAREELDR
jgi:hypothetical protein